MKISQLPSGGQALGTDIVPIVRNGQDFTVLASTLFLATPINIPFTGSLNPIGNRVYAGSSDTTNSFMFMSGSSISGAASVAANGVISPFNLYISADTVDVTTSGANLLRMLSVEIAPAVGHTGGRSAIYGEVVIVGTPSVPASAAGYVGGEFFGVSTVNLGGTAGVVTNWLGGVYGANPTARAQNTATFLAVVNGIEVDIGILTGASAARKQGIAVVKQALDRVQGTYDDTGMTFTDQDAFGLIPPWIYGYGYGAYTAAWPFDATSTLMYAWQRQAGVATVAATATLANKGYKIISTGGGSTDWTLIGAANNTPGTVFIATGAGAGTGTAQRDQSVALNGIDFTNVLFKTNAIQTQGFSVGNAGKVLVASATAIPAAGNLSVGITLTSTANFGVFVGSGAPTISASKGSLYLRSDGASNVTRAYIATDSVGTWTAINTVA